MAKSFSEVIGQQVAAARDRRGWTQQRLADELARVDTETTLNRAAVAKIESGVRGVSLDELALIAATLNVPPPVLLLPLGVEDTVRIGSSLEVATEDAVAWLLGDAPPLSQDGWLEGSRPLELYKRLRTAWREVRFAEALIQRRRDQGDAEAVQSARDALAEALNELYGVLRDMRAARLRPSPVHTGFLDDMEYLGLDVAGLRGWADEREN